MKSNFNLGDKYNFENEVSLSIELEKTCFSQGELINGTIILTPKPNSTITELINPFAKISFYEKHCYEFLETYHEEDNNIIKPTRKLTKELKSLGLYSMDFSKYKNAKLNPNLKIPFQIKTPNESYPSCFFEKNAFVIHFIVCEFESLKVKKSFPIIIKNNYYFSKENKLLQIPAIYRKDISKSKFGLLSCGNFAVMVTLDKNICPYNEHLPIKIDIDCTNLTGIKIKGIMIYLIRSYRKNAKINKKFLKEEKKEELVQKILPLKEGLISYQIEDDIKIPKSGIDLNPEEVYKLLDKDKNPITEKFENVRLYPSCSGGLLSCQYNIKIIIETNTLFSANEEIIIPIDFYSPFNNKDDNNNKNEININTNNEEIIDVNNIDNNLNINQQVFISENDNQSGQNNKSSNNKNKGFEILVNDNDDE